MCPGFASRSDYEAAVAEAQTAVRLDEDSAWASVALGNALLGVGDNEGAEAAFTAAIRKAPGLSIARSMRAMFYTSYLGEDEKAVADANEAVRIGPHDPHAFAFRGLIIAMRATPQWRGRMQFWRGEYAAAKEDLSKALSLAPLQARSYRVRALVHARLGARARAAADRRRAVQLEPRLRRKDTKLQINVVQPGLVGEEIGLLLGDIVVSYDGHAMYNDDDLLDRVFEVSKRPRVLQVLRNGKRLRLQAPAGALGVRFTVVEPAT